MRKTAIKNKKKKIITLTLVFGIILTSFIIWTVWGNNTLDSTVYTVSDNNLPSEFSGYTIAQVSDLHNAQMGDDNEKIISRLKEIKPDMIAITGDLVDSRHTDIDVSMSFVKQAVKIAPCYYVSGNHEARLAEYESIKNQLVSLGVTVLSDTATDIEKNGQEIKLLGVDDPRSVSEVSEDYPRIINEKIESIDVEDTYTILLSHRPELFETYKENEINLVLTGHAHGGQFRVPFLGGVLVPNQGFFPKYDAGKFEEENTTMIISRGIGNSVFPFRLNNNPELVIVKLENNK